MIIIFIISMEIIFKIQTLYGDKKKRFIVLITGIAGVTYFLRAQVIRFIKRKKRSFEFGKRSTELFFLDCFEH